MATGLVIDVDCERKEWVVLRLLRLGDSSIRYVLTIQETPLGRELLITTVRQLEGDALISGSSFIAKD